MIMSVGNGTRGFSVTNNKKGTGTSANDLLSDTFKSMVVEVVYVQGFEPTTAAINDFIALNARTFKPQRYNCSKKSYSFAGATYTTADIMFIEDNRTKYNTADQIAVWLFFLPMELLMVTRE
jgi:hypothetical protein